MLELHRFYQAFEHYINSIWLSPKHCTSRLLLDIVTTSFDNTNNGNYAVLLFLDLKKAFDTVDYNILLKLLSHHGIRSVERDLFVIFSISLRSHY